MTIITIDCPGCDGAAQVPAAGVLLDVGLAVADPGVGGRLHCVCPACGDMVSRLVSWPLLVALVSVGAALLDEESAA